MAKIEWYRNKTWGAQIDADFEAHLKRARGTFHKAQYIKIQGIELLDTADKTNHEQGVRLLQRVLYEYPAESSMVEGSHNALATYYLGTEDFEKAEQHFRTAIKMCKYSHDGHYDIRELYLAKTILKSDQTGKFDEAFKYLIKHDKSEFTFGFERFYHAELGALLCHKMEKKDKARSYAKRALELSQVTKPDLYRHPTVGLVEASEAQLKALEKIAGLK
jgi:tetratricopeptide (TPR) repeat protein